MATTDLRIETSEFKKALDVLSSVTPRKAAMPLLYDACVRYDEERRIFTIESTDADQFIRLECWRPSEDEESGRRPWMINDSHARGDSGLKAFCINVADFREAFSMLPSMPAFCYLTIGEHGGQMKVLYGKGEFTLPVNAGGSPEEYPAPVPVIEKGVNSREGVEPVTKFAIETERLLPVIAAARCCASQNELQPQMRTVCMDAFHDHLVVVASDGHSLFKQTVDTGMGWLRYGEFPATGSAKLLIPSTSLSPLVKAFAGSNDITVTADTQRIRIESGDGQAMLVFQTPDGKYPNYESVIPKDCPYRLLLSKSELAVTLRRSLFFADESSEMAVLGRKEDQFTIEASDEGRGRNNSESVAIINADCTLPMDFKIGCKMTTLQKILDCVSTENVLMELTDEKKPMLLREDSKASGLQLMLMPMLINPTA